MSVFKCKMCGGTIEFESGASVGTCEYCGTKQTLPKLDDDRRANLYDRANHFRRNNEFDKAAGIYEQILNEDRSDAEAYWSLVLCRYGIEYVEDPTTHKRVPTINRAQFTSIFDDEDYKSAIQYADSYQRGLYEEEANTINEIQKGILAVSQKEDPFDVFICYKETDQSGRRTQDSVLANDLYHQLTQEGFKVFFARISLEDKLGTAYEPYIFAALNSAKVMVVLGTRPEYFNAVWVKNEWSRYLALVKKSGGKKVLIPAYRDMDPYDLPEEFSHLQAQDMSKLGFMQDLIRGIKKIAQTEPTAAAAKETVVVNSGNANITPLLKRAFMFLEDGKWDDAYAYCEKVLDQDPENAQAYIGKLMVDLQVKTKSELANQRKPFDGNGNYQKALRFGDEIIVSELKQYIATAKENKQEDQMRAKYDSAVNEMKSASSESDFQYAAEQFRQIYEYKDSDELYEKCLEEADQCVYNGYLAIMDKSSDEEGYKAAAELFKKISGYKDADELYEKCLEKAEGCRKDIIYNSAKECMNAGGNTDSRIRECNAAIELFESIPGWRDADSLVEFTRRRIEELKESAERERIAQEQRAEQSRIAAEKVAKKRRKAIIIGALSLIVIAVAISLYITVFAPIIKYNRADKLAKEGELAKAAIAFGKMEDYKDSRARSFELWDSVADRATIAAGGDHTVALKYDGTVVAVGDNTYGQTDVEEWNDIIAVAAGYTITVGLKSDGTVVTAGVIHPSAEFAYGNISTWTDIVAITAGYFEIAGLRKDGTVLCVSVKEDEYNEVIEFQDIAGISSKGLTGVVGLKSDGTVVTTGWSDEDKQRIVDGWSDVTSVYLGFEYIVARMSNGSYSAVFYDSFSGENDNKYESSALDFDSFGNVKSVSVGAEHSVGLRFDGSVVATGRNHELQCNVDDWTDIVAISAGYYHTVGLKSDGTVIAVGANKKRQCDIYEWTDIKLP